MGEETASAASPERVTTVTLAVATSSGRGRGDIGSNSNAGCNLSTASVDVQRNPWSVFDGSGFAYPRPGRFTAAQDITGRDHWYLRVARQLQPPQSVYRWELGMDHVVSVQPTGGLSKASKVAGLILGGTSVVALMIGWIAFLLWLVAEVVIAIVHWL